MPRRKVEKCLVGSRKKAPMHCGAIGAISGNRRLWQRQRLNDQSISLYCPRAHSYFSLAALNFQKAALPRTEEEFSAEEQLGNDRPNHCYLGGRNDGENTSC